MMGCSNILVMKIYILTILAFLLFLTCSRSAFASGFGSTRVSQIIPELCNGIVERTGQTYTQFVEEHYSEGNARNRQFQGLERAQKAACDGNFTVPHVTSRSLQPPLRSSFSS